MAMPWERDWGTADAPTPAPKPWEKDWSGAATDAAPPVSDDAPSTGMDVLKSIPAGLAEGISGLVGLPGDLNRVVAEPMARMALKAVGVKPSDSPTPTGLLPTSQQALNGVEDVTGKLPESKTEPGKIARTISAFAPNALIGPGGIARRVITQDVLPAIGSELAGKATEGTPAEPVARVVGALAGGLTPTLASRVVSPLPIPATRQAAVDTLRAEGVHPTAGQITGSKKLQYAESELGGLATERVMDRQKDQFTAAALRRVGETADRATPDVMAAARDRIGNQFDTIAARNTLRPDRQLGSDLYNAVGQYNSVVPPTMRAPIVSSTLADIQSLSANGQIAGNAYQALRSRLGKAAQGAAKDPQLADVLHGMQHALDAGMERSMISSGNLRDAGALRVARRQYRGLLALEKASTGAGEDAAMGAISPARLRQAAVGQGRRAYATGQGDFSDLARSGQAILTPLPQSGTAPRAAVRIAPTIIGAALGGHGGGIDAAMGAALGAAVPAVTGRALMSRPMQAYLANQVAARGPMLSESLRRAAIVGAVTDPRLISQSPPLEPQL